jgi:hypothetical protein
MAGMSSPANPQRFRLQRGVTTGAVEEGRIIEPTEYLVDSDREYDVYLHQAGPREMVGTCSVTSGPAGSYLVVPGFAINLDAADGEFSGAWDTDHARAARLKHVWMTVEGA